MKKKLLSLALVLTMVLTLLPTAAFAASDEDTAPPEEIPAAEEVQAAEETPKAEEAPAAGETPSTDKTPAAGETSADDKTPAADESAGGTDGADKDGAGTTTPTTPTTPAAPTLEHVPAKAPTCTASGNLEYYKDAANNKYYYDAEGTKPTTLDLVTLPAAGHKRPDSSAGYERLSDTQHSYSCPSCTQTIAESHTFSGNVCSYCGFTRTVIPSPYRYIDITSAYVNRYSITVTWTSDAVDGTLFDIYVDGSLRASGVAPSKSSSSSFTYTVDFSHYLGDSYYNVSVYLYHDHSTYDTVRVSNRYYDDYYYDYYYPTYNPAVTPDTNSYGIPYASQVTGRYSASEAIRILRNASSYSLQRDLMNSSSALNSFESLERAVKNANNVSVSVDIDRSDVPSPFRSGISISGAAFNASRNNSTVRLVVDGPSQTRYSGHGYQFSMTLTGVDNAYSLDVPVVVTLPLPSDINSSYVQVLHYHGSGSPTVITPKVSGRTITFPLTGFSDFVVTDGGAYYTGAYGGYVYTSGYVADGYGGYVPVAFPGQPARRKTLMEQHLEVVLPILASTPPSGYVYDDVSGSYWASTQIAWVKDLGIMSGYFDGTFRPESGTTRQELWMVLARLAGANPADMEAARQWAITAGISDGRSPFSPLSCQQMISMLYRYARYRGFDTSAPANNLAFYRDGASVAPYARTAMSWAANWGIVVADGDNCLNPENIATRADFAVYLYRLLS